MSAPLTTPQIAVFVKATGELEYIAPMTLAPPDDHADSASAPLPEGYNDRDFVWSAESRCFIEDVAQVEEDECDRVDREAGEVRSRFLTQVPGQDMTYFTKEQEARRFLDGGSPPFRFLAAESRGTSVPMESLARRIVDEADRWHRIGAAIEGARMRAKKNIRDGQTRAHKRDAGKVDWDKVLKDADVPDPVSAPSGLPKKPEGGTRKTG